MIEIRTQHSTHYTVVGHKDNEILSCVAQVTTCTDWQLRGNVRLQRPRRP